MVNLETAIQAAKILRDLGVGAVLITAGKDGAYLLADGVEEHIPIPNVQINSTARDATGCGDQTMAALCARLQAGDSLTQAARTGVLAGTLQFYRTGVQPVSAAELAEWQHKA